jgi:ubiquinone/menaquinone biosynthesis C-methylase UbiE
MLSNTNNETPSKWGTATETSATRYSQTNNIQQSVGQNLAQMMNISKGQSVLVVGCGPGSDALAIAQIVGETGKVVGMDLDRHSIDKAQATLDQYPELKSYVTSTSMQHTTGSPISSSSSHKLPPSRRAEPVLVSAPTPWIIQALLS